MSDQLNEVTVWEQIPGAGWDFFSITGAVLAVDFILEEDWILSAATVWLEEFTQESEGVLDGFGGTLGWAIFSNTPAGPPGG